MFALVDCNNFYASCERVFRPDLIGKPVVVLSNNDGCVIARSNEAKNFGIPMGAAAFKFREVFEKNKIHVFSSNYALYGDMSSRVMNILSSFTPRIEIYSIDEAFLSFDGFSYTDLNELGRKIKFKVEKETGIPVSIGFAPTKALSKVANRIAKKFPDRTGGVYLIDSDEKRIKALKWLQVEDVWGIGRQFSKKLEYYGIKTAYDFVSMSDSFVKKNLTVVGLRLKHDLEGKRTLETEEASSKKSIAVTRSFDTMLDEVEKLRERVSTFAATCGEKLRKQNSDCNLVTVFIQTNFFRQDLPQYTRSITVRTPFPTNSSIYLIRTALNALQSIYFKGYLFKRAGVIVSGLTSSESRQLNIFENDDPRHIQLMKSIDKINRSIGRRKVKFAGQSQDRTWKMKQELLSPRYTTSFDEIIIVNC